jgi:hypothetical protein
MGCVCADCGRDLPQTSYSSNQWWKGLGLSRYATCVHGHCSDTSSTQQSDSGRDLPQTFYSSTSGGRVWASRDAPPAFMAIARTLLPPNNPIVGGTIILRMPVTTKILSTTLSHRVPFVGLPRGFTPTAHGLASPAFGNVSRRVLFSKRNTLFWTSRQSTWLWSLSTASTSRKSIHALPLSHAGACLTVESEYAMSRLWCCDFRIPKECLHSLKWTWPWVQGKSGTTELTACSV